jgi:glutathione peroxidase
MNIFRKIINLTYPVRMKLSKITGMGIHILENKNSVAAPEDFYKLKAILNNGEEISFAQFKGKKVLIVNLASQCGFTPQYNELEKLYRENTIEILGFPSNNFGDQEPGSDDEIFNFCKINYGVTFPLFKKNDVKGTNKQQVFKWLTDKGKNGWNDQEPKWNFYKFLIDERGNLSKIFSSSVVPEDK